MFERFTERARRVITLAQEEAKRLNHSAVGTEHILLGIIREGEGVASKTMESLNISPGRVRAEIESAIGRGERTPYEEVAFTPRAKKILELALDEARRLGHNYIGTEHMLLGLIREGEGVAALVLEAMGADLERVRAQVVYLLGEEESSISQGRAGSSPVVRGRERLQEASFAQLSLEEFAGRLASADPTPGGGSAAATAGALAAALIAMVSRLTDYGELSQIRREKEDAIKSQDFERAVALRDREVAARRSLEGVSGRFALTIQVMDLGRSALLKLAREDAAAFDDVMAAMRLPRGSDEQKQARSEAVQRALRRAAEVPFEVAHEALQILDAAPRVMRHGKKSALSDVATGVYLAYAALQAAIANVRINVSSIKEEAYRTEAAGRVREIVERAEALRDEALAVMQERLAQ